MFLIVTQKYFRKKKKNPTKFTITVKGINIHLFKKNSVEKKVSLEELNMTINKFTLIINLKDIICTVFHVTHEKFQKFQCNYLRNCEGGNLLKW